MLIQRADVTDIWFEDDEALVIIEEAIFRLTPLAVAIWDILETPLEFDELGRELEALFGPPPDGTLAEALTSFVDTMTRNGILMKS
ncbi:PqqD family peptide modification chaperone [Cutibacterium sp. V947]|uniref:PqqD family peptide modification chaperone n=1 Tax=unclassified Cutibacterium TaxID=2649671 RepID=UPI003EE019D4